MLLRGRRSGYVGLNMADVLHVLCYIWVFSVCVRDLFDFILLRRIPRKGKKSETALVGVGDRGALIWAEIFVLEGFQKRRSLGWGTGRFFWYWILPLFLVFISLFMDLARISESIEFTCSGLMCDNNWNHVKIHVYPLPIGNGKWSFWRFSIL